MSNPINGVSRGNIPVTPTTAKPGSAKSGGAENTSAGAPAQDAVNLTNAAESLQELEKSLAADAVISTEKVDAIKAALSEGSYQIDPDLIAEKFLEVERALGKV